MERTVNTTRALLEQTAPFKDLDDVALERLVVMAREQQFEAGDALFREMTEGDEIFFIMDGSVRMSVELASAYHMVEEIEGGAGDLVGEGRFIAEGPRPATVTALTPVSALVWDVSDWQALAENHPDAGYRLAVHAGKVLFARVQELKDHLIDDMAWGLE